MHTQLFWIILDIFDKQIQIFVYSVISVDISCTIWFIHIQPMFLIY